MSGMASPRDYNMYNVAEAQFWKQRVQRETAVLTQSDEISKLIVETKSQMRCSPFPPPPHRARAPSCCTPAHMPACPQTRARKQLPWPLGLSPAAGSRRTRRGGKSGTSVWSS